MTSDSVMDTLRAFAAERDWRQFHTPENLAKSISIEAAELLECFQWGPDADRDEVAGELASPYSNISNLSVFSTDGEAKIGQNISVGLAQVLDMVKSTTGVDFQDTLQRAAEGGRAVREQSEQTRGEGLSPGADPTADEAKGEA